MKQALDSACFFLNSSHELWYNRIENITRWHRSLNYEVIIIISRTILLVSIIVLLSLIVVSVFPFLYSSIMRMQEDPLSRLRTLEIEVNRSIIPSPDRMPNIWAEDLTPFGFRLLGFFGLSLIALIYLRISSTSEDIRRVLGLLFLIGILLMPIGMLLGSYFPSNIAGALTLAGVICLLISIIDASMQFIVGVKK